MPSHEMLTQLFERMRMSLVGSDVTDEGIRNMLRLDSELQLDERVRRFMSKLLAELGVSRKVTVDYDSYGEPVVLAKVLDALGWKHSIHIGFKDADKVHPKLENSGRKEREVFEWQVDQPPSAEELQARGLAYADLFAASRYIASLSEAELKEGRRYTLFDYSTEGSDGFQEGQLICGPGLGWSLHSLVLYLGRAEWEDIHSCRKVLVVRTSS